MTVFAANLGLILSILWCFCHGLLFSLPLLHHALQPAASCAPEVGQDFPVSAVFLYVASEQQDLGLQSQEEARLRGNHLIAYSLAVLLLVFLCMLLAAVACIALGAGSHGIQVLLFAEVNCMLCTMTGPSQASMQVTYH